MQKWSLGLAGRAAAQLVLGMNSFHHCELVKQYIGLSYYYMFHFCCLNMRWGDIYWRLALFILQQFVFAVVKTPLLKSQPCRIFEQEMMFVSFQYDEYMWACTNAWKV